MKSALIIGAALLVLALGCVVGAGVAVGKTAETLVWTETPLYGDRAAAAGVEAAVGTSLGRRLLWDSTLSFGAAETAARTDFRFSPWQVRLRWAPEERGFQLWLDFGSGYSFPDGKTLEQLRETYAYNINWMTMLPLWQTAADQTGAGETRVTVLRLRDFYEFYPFEHSLDLGMMGGSEWEKNVQPVREFFRVPVPEDALVSVQVRKNDAGLITEINCRSGAWETADASNGAGVAWAYPVPEQAAPVPVVQADFNGVSAVTGKYCFFAFASYDAEGRPLVDASSIPGGRGVYRLPYTRDESCAASYDAAQLKTVFPLPDDEPVLALGADGENRPLLFTAADGQLTLTVLDPSGETALQRVSLGAFDPGGGWICRSLQVFDDWLLLESGTGDLNVAELGADGLWRAGLRASRAEIETHWPQPEDPDGQWTDFPSGSRAFAWDGRRLAVAEGLYERTHGGSSGNFLLEVFDESGLAYFARLDSSLPVPPPPAGASYEFVRAEDGLNGFGGFRIRFT